MPVTNVPLRRWLEVLEEDRTGPPASDRDILVLKGSKKTYSNHLDTSYMASPLYRKAALTIPTSKLYCIRWLHETGNPGISSTKALRLLLRQALAEVCYRVY